MRFKDSGIEWLGEIPEHWEIKPLKAIFNQRNEQNSDLKINNILSLVKDIGVIPYEEKGNLGNKSKDKLQEYKIAKVNDLVINKMNAVIGSLGLSKYEGLVSPVYLVLYIDNPNHFINYYSYIFQTKEVQHFLKTFSYGIMEIREAIDYLEFKKMSLPLPPLEEQKAIAEFLDKKCDKISQFIESKQKLITLLQEKKQTLINAVVCRGLNKNTELKESGVKYLGTIPKHWEVRRLASFGKFSKGGNIGRNNLLDEGISTLIYGDIYTKYEIKTHTLHSKVSQETAKNATPIYKGDILFSGSGETKEDIGKNIVYLGDEKAFAGGDVIIFRQNQNDALFLSYALNTQGVRFCKFIESKGEIIVHIYASNLRDIKIPLPPLQEQKAIASYLDTQTTKIDLAIEKTKQQIALIKEYKQTLISQAICGKMQQKD